MNFIDRNRELGRLEAALKGCKSKKIVYVVPHHIPKGCVSFVVADSADE